MNSNQTNLNDLPELPFEKVLSYLSLEDVIKSKAVSRRWYQVINSFRVKSLCYSDRPSGFLYGKTRLVSGAFAQNFISSARITSFFDTLGQSILWNLKHLRLCDLKLNPENDTAFAQILQSFGQLEELDIIRLGLNGVKNLELNLPMLKSFRLKGLNDIKQLTLDAPKLKKVKLMDCPFSLIVNFVHAKSVETLVTGDMSLVEVKKLKNLKYLFGVVCLPEIDSKFLTDLNQLKEIYLTSKSDIRKIFEQKQRYGRTDLKIFFLGLLSAGLDDPVYRFSYFEEALVYLAENPSRLAGEMPFLSTLQYSAIQRVAPESAINMLTKFTDLYEIIVDEPVQDVQLFLDLLKNLDRIVKLQFNCAQTQDLFDRLPEHCAVQGLIICGAPSDFRFLFRLKHLIFFDVEMSMDAESVRKIFRELLFVSHFQFKYATNKLVRISILKDFVSITVDGKHNECLIGVDANHVIKFLDNC